MNKINGILLTLLGFGASLLANEVSIEKTKMHNFKSSVNINAKIIQLSNAKESISSLVSGHLEKYYVEPAQIVKKGDKIALIESIEISKMTANYIALKQQYKVAQTNYQAINKLYKSGMSSVQDLNIETIKKSEISAKLLALKSQLHTLNIKVNNLNKATSKVVLYAHSSGSVAALMKPVHSTISSNETIVSIVKNKSYYIKSFLPIEYAPKINIGDTLIVNYLGKGISSKITQIMPRVDEATQKLILISSITDEVKDIYLGTYLKATVYFSETKNYLAVKKSGLSFFNNEWVVFVPVEEEDNSEEEEGVPYAPQVIEIVTEDEEYVGVNGLSLGQDYVSDKSYYVKSAILKSSLGDGD